MLLKIASALRASQRQGDNKLTLLTRTRASLKGMGLDKLKVNCYSGHTYAKRPGSFLWQGIKYEAREIARAWQEPGEKHLPGQN